MPDNILLKILLFEYNVSKLIEWHNEVSAETFSFELNDFSKLKCIKLHFFTCSQNTELLKIFDNFKALPLGPVETDILEAINSNKLNFYSIKLGLNLKDGISVSASSPSEIRLKNTEHILNFNEVDIGISKLKKLNSNLVLLGANELVEISHHWKSWKEAFSLAKKSKRRSHEIDADSVINEPMKYYGN